MVLLSGLLTCHSMGPQGHFFENIFWQWGHSSVAKMSESMWTPWHMGEKKHGEHSPGTRRQRNGSCPIYKRSRYLDHDPREVKIITTRTQGPEHVTLRSIAVCIVQPQNTHTLTLIYTHFPCLSGMHVVCRGVDRGVHRGQRDTRGCVPLRRT